jgi:hypothetical protein
MLFNQRWTQPSVGRTEVLREIRIPNTEIRKKSEIRNRKGSSVEFAKQLIASNS